MYGSPSYGYFFYPKDVQVDYVECSSWAYIRKDADENDNEYIS